MTNIDHEPIKNANDFKYLNAYLHKVGISIIFIREITFLRL